MAIIVQKHNLEHWTRCVETDAHFSFSRWGDGEWACLLGDSGQNCDRHRYFPELAGDLRLILNVNRPYFKGWLPVAKNAGVERIDAFLANIHPPVEWVDGDVFLAASCTGTLAPFVAVLRPRRVLYVGPAHLAKLANIIGWQDAGFIEVPAIDAYKEKQRVLDQIKTALRDRYVDVIGFSCGMLANVLIDDLWPYTRHHITAIDFGSLWDVYCGVTSRSHNRRGNWPVLIEQNLGRVPWTA